MAIIYIIGAFQLLSVAVNVLALASFWITPGLRTTANRFVINLLIVNVVGCLALTPALWNGGLLPTTYNGSEIMFDDNNEFRASLHKLSENVPSSTVAEKSTVAQKIVEHDYAFNSKIRPNDQKNMLNRTYHDKTSRTPTNNIQYSDCTRFWGFDLVAALGKFLPTFQLSFLKIILLTAIKICKYMYLCSVSFFLQLTYNFVNKLA